MYRILQILFVALCLVISAHVVGSRAAEDLGPLIDQLGSAKLSEMDDHITALAKTGDAKVIPVLEALGEGELYQRKSDGRVFLVKAQGADLLLVDPVTGADAGAAPKAAMQKVKVNNAVRRAVRSALGGLTLFSDDTSARIKAAQSMLQTPNADALEAIETAIAAEKDGTVRKVLDEARAVTLLVSDRPDDQKRQAIALLAEGNGRNGLAVLTSALATADASLKPDIEAAIARIEQTQAFWSAGQNIWYGLSLGSVLLLAAIGLAITFGVMGIINMAHGEMVMLGAYTTFLVQEVVRNSYPDLFDWSLAIALPLAFLVTGAVGLAIERGVIRFLYGRPLETLLATWGISLILQQAVRSIFGPTNREVGNPSWMSGAFELGGLTITWNRLWIIVFALAVFAALLFLLKRTSMGLKMRAVTQNRRMASSMGIRTPWVDALTFALGSGIAGMAGVALSQIDNVSPNLGQGYIIDSFMVVVFGGVGNLWGTLVGAFSLGILNKFLEPYAGAVLGKILVLVLIILFIQKKPRGLFALKGRAVEA
ncbi:urea ABC transporter permease subunit UrtB [Ensifer sp. ENS07]|uniref:urea ABC transporter permease subunit UrtB n=1 Tax=Ensifer TaxID=106591 RepID=UPI000723FDB1|nr:MULTISPECIES: urea ABC transporter permease subunit UrtB [Ensifer]KSV77216.1 urea ABC transporter permease [Sinorhizobium sp. GW3]OWZ95326.1 branched-chain amino acid ABC transporter permease [Sinorhizobium sp. LM21]MBD9494174.1 urea ABC transporter permease subunit UrtB [Ensifer sp. ENS01]MBD9639498.1 urea ABC transporter permease subunit UrtB [Ensifer sp. ENS07]MBW0368475.1 urea ABC transporter permease subunit UrtB [Ensifer adhaerens]